MYTIYVLLVSVGIFLAYAFLEYKKRNESLKKEKFWKWGLFLALGSGPVALFIVTLFAMVLVGSDGGVGTVYAIVIGGVPVALAVMYAFVTFLVKIVFFFLRKAKPGVFPEPEAVKRSSVGHLIGVAVITLGALYLIVHLGGYVVLWLLS